MCRKASIPLEDPANMEDLPRDLSSASETSYKSRGGSIPETQIGPPGTRGTKGQYETYQGPLCGTEAARQEDQPRPDSIPSQMVRLWSRTQCLV